jgi:hypothetical protein
VAETLSSLFTLANRSDLAACVRPPARRCSAAVEEPAPTELGAAEPTPAKIT